MKKIALSLTALLGAVSLLLAEISVFEAGNINSQNPYGLTDSEKSQLQNRQNVESIRSDVSTAKENIEGLKSILDSLHDANQRAFTRITDLENNSTATAEDLKDELKKLSQTVQKNRASQEATNKKILAAIAELAAIIDSGATKNIDDNTSLKTDKTAAPSQTKPSKTAPADTLKNADNAFKAKDYQNAKSLFEELVAQKHRPAYANYMLGEIEYAQQNYAGALPYYKNSVEISQKGSYVPRLLYHTAISYDKIGEKDNANKFYKALKQAYPESAEATASPNRK